MKNDDRKSLHTLNNNIGTHVGKVYVLLTIFYYERVEVTVTYKATLDILVAEPVLKILLGKTCPISKSNRVHQ